MKYKNLSTNGSQYTIITVVGKKQVYSFEPKKNAWLTENRGISFEQIIAVLESKGAVDIIEHPNTDQYSHQQIFLVELSNYIYLVPFVEQRINELFLKTIFPSRKMTKKYLTKTGDYDA